MMKIDIHGLIAAGFSPFDIDGNLNLKPIQKLVDQLIEDGISGFYLMGSTGEGLSLALQDRKLITERYIKAINHRVPVIVNVSHTSYEVSRNLIHHAVRMGADAVSATLTSYYPISTIDQLIYGIEKISECQDKIPFIYYHIPSKTGLNFNMLSFLDQLDGRLPQLGGIKYTAGTIDDFMLCRQKYGDRYKMYFGVDELFLPALALGVDSFMGSTYNFMLPLYQLLLENYDKNEKEQALHYYHQIVLIIKTFLKYDGLAAQKAIMRMAGHDFGPPRSPVIPLTSKEYKTLEAALQKINYFDHAILSKV
ncbi:dihydrodipicolinate synthase family protein [uncultured Polaribacter sp.]|uniref:dihydrodipicolinate synthase family protein n=1 Tax=uncultured Polaribacter sp. TaxID=174711 RepID=UPI00262F74C1|nr:dihydrodipicolinate synthase family protein [uncultured Polaribacter sp.]